MHNLQKEIKEKFNVKPTYKDGVVKFTIPEINVEGLLQLQILSENHEPEKLSIKKCKEGLKVKFYLKFIKEFKVNEFTTLKNVLMLGIFDVFDKHGELCQYEKFTAQKDGKSVTGYMSSRDGNIYKLEEV